MTELEQFKLLIDTSRDRLLDYANDSLSEPDVEGLTTAAEHLSTAAVLLDLSELIGSGAWRKAALDIIAAQDAGDDK